MGKVAGVVDWNSVTTVDASEIAVTALVDGAPCSLVEDAEVWTFGVVEPGETEDSSVDVEEPIVIEVILVLSLLMLVVVDFEEEKEEGEEDEDRPVTSLIVPDELPLDELVEDIDETGAVVKVSDERLLDDEVFSCVEVLVVVLDSPFSIPSIGFLVVEDDVADE